MVKKERNSQIERLRIVSMLMIIAHHYVLYGVMQSYNALNANQVYNAGTLSHKVISAFMLPGGVVGVAIFFITAGYFGIESDTVRIRNIIEITYFYAWLGIGLRFVVSRLGFVESLAPHIFLENLFPISTELYWFSSAYIMIMFMKPVLNRYIHLETLERSIIRICVLFLVYAILRTVNAHYLGIVNGIIYYVWGVLKQHQDEIAYIDSKVLLIAFAIGWIGYVLSSHLSIPVINEFLPNCIFGYKIEGYQGIGHTTKRTTTQGASNEEENRTSRVDTVRAGRNDSAQGKD